MCISVGTCTISVALMLDILGYNSGLSLKKKTDGQNSMLEGDHFDQGGRLHREVLPSLSFLSFL
jgi:hypothetical protein